MLFIRRVKQLSNPPLTQGRVAFGDALVKQVALKCSRKSPVCKTCQWWFLVDLLMASWDETGCCFLYFLMGSGWNRSIFYFGGVELDGTGLKNPLPCYSLSLVLISTVITSRNTSHPSPPPMNYIPISHICPPQLAALDSYR